MGDVITLSTAWTIRPLTVQAVIAYFKATTPAGVRSDRWNMVFQRLRSRTDNTVRTVLRSPLMVSLARIAYGDNPNDPTELLNEALQTREALELHLLDGLIPAVYPPSRPRRGSYWQATDAARWLSFIAKKLSWSTGQDFCWWQLERAAPRILIEVVRVVPATILVGSILSPYLAVLFFGAWLVAHLVTRSRMPTVETWLQVMVLPRLGRNRAASLSSPSTLAVLAPHHRRPLEKRLALAFARTIAALAGAAAAFSLPNGSSIYLMVWRGVSVALAVGLMIGFFVVSPRMSPTEVQFRARRGARVFARQVLLALFLGSAVGLVVGIILGSMFGIIAGLAVGVAIGLIDGLNIWLDVSADVTRALSPTSTLVADKWAALARSSAIGLTIFAAAGAAAGLAYGGSFGLINATAFGVAFALSDPYEGVASTSWGRYWIAKGVVRASWAVAVAAGVVP
jgi:MFS family permease